MVNLTIRRLTPGKKTQYLLNRRLDGFQSLSGRF